MHVITIVSQTHESVERLIMLRGPAIASTARMPDDEDEPRECSHEPYGAMRVYDGTLGPSGLRQLTSRNSAECKWKTRVYTFSK